MRQAQPVAFVPFVDPDRHCSSWVDYLSSCCYPPGRSLDAYKQNKVRVSSECSHIHTHKHIDNKNEPKRSLKRMHSIISKAADVAALQHEKGGGFKPGRTGCTKKRSMRGTTHTL